MLHPRLEVRPRHLNFGRVHLQSSKELRVGLCNPTNVDAAWAVTVEGIKPRFPTLPGAGAAASATAQAEAAVAAGGGGAQLQWRILPTAAPREAQRMAPRNRAERARRRRGVAR